MKLKRILLTLTLLMGVMFNVSAQSSMTDNQVMQFMIKENERGTPRAEIVTKLIERGVTIEQIKRIRDKYEKQQSGTVVGAKDISGVSNDKKRLRSNYAEEDEVPGNNQRKALQKKVNTSLLSEKQRKAYER